MKLSYEQLERLLVFSFKLVNKYQSRRAFIRHGVITQALDGMLKGKTK